ncbi:MAG: iron-containing alcohol dehydrogenase, partial [Lachnospiraceae bacterium]|nr:iron-containing alcohol dehydrogenase [Lachnospiraceae bacterium]
MANRLTINYEKKPCYDIVFAHDFSGLLEELQDLNVKERRVAIIADSNTASLYGEQVRALLDGNCLKVILHSFPAGEDHKTLDTVKDIYKTLIEEKYDRKDLLLALGGGVVGDITGYT